jgi:hypothetical protein
MSENALLCFHQGWTDIINCLPMINICSAKYRLVYLLIREDASLLVRFYIRGMTNVVLVCAPHKHLDRFGIKLVDVARHRITKFELIGLHDAHRPLNDVYRGAFRSTLVLFERSFYETYGMPYSDRVNKFMLYRDPVAEEAFYNRMVKQEPYICIHTNRASNLLVYPKTSDNVIELDKSSDMFFDSIRVLQHAKEIHLIDSVWAIMCYMIDAKHGMLNGIPIYVYCHRGYQSMFTEPIKLSNWTVYTPSMLCDEITKE